MKLSQLKIVIPSILLLLIAVFFLNKKNFMLSQVKSSSNTTSEYIAQASSSYGNVQFKSSRNTKMGNISEYPFNLYNKSQVLTHSGASAQINVNDDWVIDIDENSLAELQTWGEGAQQKLILHIIRGSYRVVTSGEVENLLVLNNSRFYEPGQPFNLNKPLAMKFHSPEEGLIKDQSQLNNKNDDKTTSSQDIDKEFSNNSASYIEASIFKQRPQLEKCLAHRIRQQSIISGRILIGFNVTPNGILKNINIIDNKTQDKQIENCILDIFTQLRIRNYNGPETFFAFPLDFK